MQLMVFIIMVCVLIMTADELMRFGRKILAGFAAARSSDGEPPADDKASKK